MMTFRNENLAKLKFPMEIVRLIAEINQYKGRQDLFRQQSPQILDALKQTAVIESTEASNAIEGITIKADRLKQLMAEKTSPKNRSEGEIAGYRDVLATVHASNEAISITPNVIRQLHRDLYKFSAAPGGNWKPADNAITEVASNGEKLIRSKTVPAYLTPEAMEELCKSFNNEFEVQKTEPLILIGTFILDFLCIHPFHDGNGRMSRLLTLLLLYKFDYEVGRYISIEKLIEKSKESYYDTLQASSIDWHEGKHDIMPWLGYFLGVILAAYRDFSDRVGNITNYKGSKSDRIEDAIKHFLGDFTISDIEKACPDISRPTIYRVLKELKEKGLIKPIEVGRNAKWKKERQEGRFLLS